MRLELGESAPTGVVSKPRPHAEEEVAPSSQDILERQIEGIRKLMMDVLVDILKLVGKRQKLSRELGELKRKLAELNGQRVRIFCPEQAERVEQGAVEEARKHGLSLSEKEVLQVVRLLMELSTDAQNNEVNGHRDRMDDDVGF